MDLLQILVSAAQALWHWRRRHAEDELILDEAERQARQSAREEQLEVELRWSLIGCGGCLAALLGAVVLFALLRSHSYWGAAAIHASLIILLLVNARSQAREPAVVNDPWSPPSRFAPLRCPTVVRVALVVALVAVPLGYLVFGYESQGCEYCRGQYDVAAYWALTISMAAGSSLAAGWFQLRNRVPLRFCAFCLLGADLGAFFVAHI